ncbi:hypothetical protein VKT23_018972 [Stygiomarasmius scandens]|uniref:AB hydrolase-1 domain-containing protein n=1 Tax=Marasmiellus scandens TaxID=2682957 RepID=A0ABR1IMP4_9AGAR
MIEMAYQAPLNYSNPGVGSTAIAMVKLNATMENGLEYGGPIFVNPGGPGGPGVLTLILGGPEGGEALQERFGNQFDVIGFDPRGVVFSTPNVTIPLAVSREYSDLNSTSDALPEAWAEYQAFGQAARALDNGLLDFVHTGNVARDMLGMVEALGQEKLQYFGQSYGTALGATFATMFPACYTDALWVITILLLYGFIGTKLEVTGCVDMDDYFGNGFTTTGLLDADKAMQTFFDGCHSAGPEACPFYASSPSKIADNLETIYASLRSQPAPVFTGETSGVLTYDALRNAVFTAISTPYPLFQTLATGLADLSNGNGTIIFEMMQVLPPAFSSATFSSGYSEVALT